MNFQKGVKYEKKLRTACLEIQKKTQINYWSIIKLNIYAIRNTIYIYIYLYKYK